MKGNNSVGVRKGAWTSEEDVLLKKCIDKFGEGEWHKVPRRAGLNRCRKSCRLRWLNYLRPGIKRGEFEEDEVDMMLRLHKLLGNRWSLIAARLPGRTANDVKNYWNTYIEKKVTPERRKKENGMNNIRVMEPQNMVKAKVIRPHPRIVSKNLLYWLRHTYNNEVPNNKDTTFSKNISEEDNIEETSNKYHKELAGIYCSGGEDGNGATTPSTFKCISLEEELFSSCAAMEFTDGDAQLLTKNNPTDDESNNCCNDLPSSVDIWESLSLVDEENHFWEYSFLSSTESGNTKCIAQ